MYIRVSAIVKQEDGLLVTSHLYPNGRLWQLPGGKPMPGETLVVGLQRELAEELDVSVEVGSLMFVCEEILPDSDLVIHFVFEATITGGTPQVQRNQTSADTAEFVPISTLSRLTLYPNIASVIIRSDSTPNGAATYLGVCPPRPWL